MSLQLHFISYTLQILEQRKNIRLHYAIENEAAVLAVLQINQ